MLLCSVRSTSQTAVGVIDSHYLVSLIISCCKEIQFYPCKVSERFAVDYHCNRIRSTDMQLILLQLLKYNRQVMKWLQQNLNMILMPHYPFDNILSYHFPVGK